MKNSLFIIALVSLFVVSCGETKKEEVKKEVEKEVKKTTVKEVEKTEAKGDVAAGKKLFTDKGCVACHQEAVKVVGPAVKDIAAIYAEKNGDIIKFLKGEGTSIVDTDPAQVAVMQANFAVTKSFTAEQFANIAAYIKSVK